MRIIYVLNKNTR